MSKDTCFQAIVDKVNLKLVVDGTPGVYSVVIEGLMDGKFSLDTATLSFAVARFACNSLLEEGLKAKIYKRSRSKIEEVY